MLEKKVQDRLGTWIPSGPVPKRLAPRSDVQVAGGTHYVTKKMVVKVCGFFNFLLFLVLPILSVSSYIMTGAFGLAVFFTVLLKTKNREVLTAIFYRTRVRSLAMLVSNSLTD